MTFLCGRPNTPDDPIRVLQVTARPAPRRVEPEQLLQYRLENLRRRSDVHLSRTTTLAARPAAELVYDALEPAEPALRMRSHEFVTTGADGRVIYGITTATMAGAFERFQAEFTVFVGSFQLR